MLLSTPPRKIGIDVNRPLVSSPAIAGLTPGGGAMSHRASFEFGSGSGSKVVLSVDSAVKPAAFGGPLHPLSLLAVKDP
jgi:hypothetical protein